MKQPPLDSEDKKSLMASSSSASCYRQTAPESVTGYHQMPPEIHGIVIERVPDNRIGVGAGNQLHSGLDFSTVDCSALSKIVKEKNHGKLAEHGGVEGIGTSVKTDPQSGIGGDFEEISVRKSAFGTNSYVKPPTKSFSHLVWEAIKDPIILALLVCAALSLGIGIKKHGPKDGWYDGGSILLVVSLAIFVEAISNFKQYQQSDKLSEIRNNITTCVVRNGRRQKISIFETVVGDIVFLQIGDHVPADGLFIEGHSLLVDESSLTGQSNPVNINHDQNPFLLSGSKVADGYAKMLVTSVGMNTTWGEMMSSTITESNEQSTPLQAQLKKLTLLTRNVGLFVGFLILLVLLIRYFTGNTTDENGNKGFNGSKTKVDDVINPMVGIILSAVAIVVVAIPEGLPLALTLSLAYSMKRMLPDKAKVRNLSASEEIGSATTVCTDLTSTLLSNKMDVTEVSIGKKSMRGESYTSIGENVLKLFVQGISLMTSSAHKLFRVAPTDDAIFAWAVNTLNVEVDSSREGLSVLEVDASCPEKKRLGILVKRQSDNMIHEVHWRGDFESILSLCSHYYDINGNAIVLDDEEREAYRREIENMAAGSLKCTAFAHKSLSQEEYELERANKRIPDKNLVLLGVVGLKGFCRPGTKEAIEICQRAGVQVKMITGENASAARAIAMECGILSPNQEADDGSTVTGVQFCRYTEEAMEKVHVISSPFDKLLIVQCLKEKGHVVAITGDGTNDAPALREADIGLSMGIQGTELAKERSDIIILDDNFASVATVIRWGRCVYNNIQKFIQFQLTVNVAALAINFVAAVSTGKTPLTPAQLLWVNLIMNTFGAIALAAEEPSNALMNMPPRGQSNPLITNIMWRNITGQASYQIAVILALKFKGKSILQVNENVINTLIFTTFVLLQVFNQFNARDLEEKNVFKGILENKLFLGTTAVTVVIQVIMVEFLNKFAHTVRLDWEQWGVCMGIAAFSWLIGWLVKFLPVPKRPILNYLIISNRDPGQSCSFLV